MWVNGLRKCVLSILFFMCPNKFFKNSITAFPHKSEDTVNPNSLNTLVLNPYLSVPNKWIIDVIKREKDSDVNILDDDEPGFDFDEREMIKFKIWKNGIIPFFIDDFSFDKVLRDMIREFLDAVNDVTSLRFVELPRPPEDPATRWVFFINRRGLLNVDDHPIKEVTNTGMQRVVLGYNSMCTRGQLHKAVLALVGVPPQHTAPNRDEFVTIVRENIQPDKVSLFDKIKDDEWLFHDVPYDYASAGHYHTHQYTTNGFATVKPKQCKKPLLSEGNGFSHSDILKIRMLYNYISDKITDKEKNSDCAKLFKPETNFTQSLKPLLSVQTRKKPNKYLGLPDKTTDEKNDEDGEKGEKVNEKSIIEQDDKSVSDQDNDRDGTSNTKNHFKHSSVNKHQRTKLKRITTKLVFHPSDEIFRDMSDYKTE